MSCDFCGKTFSLETALIDHIYTHHMNVKFGCNLCSAEFQSDLKLRKHKRFAHNRRFKCEKCDAAFGYPCDLAEHIKVQHEGKRYNCSYLGCLITFTTRTGATKHLQEVHSKNRLSLKKKLDRKEILSQVFAN